MITAAATTVTAAGESSARVPISVLPGRVIEAEICGTAAATGELTVGPADVRAERLEALVAGVLAHVAGPALAHCVRDAIGVGQRGPGAAVRLADRRMAAPDPSGAALPAHTTCREREALLAAEEAAGVTETTGTLPARRARKEIVCGSVSRVPPPPP